jgi:aminoglycoside 3-N-acetyltransferase I
MDKHLKKMELNKKQFRIQRLGKEDLLVFQSLIQVFQEVFKMENPKMGSEVYLKSLLENPKLVVFAVIREDKVLAGLTAYELPKYYSEDSEMFLYDIGVKSEYQRKGLGKELLKVLKEYCKQNGIGEMFVSAHEIDKHALDFYHSTGGKAEKVVHFNYEINKLSNEQRRANLIHRLNQFRNPGTFQILFHDPLII